MWKVVKSSCYAKQFYLFKFLTIAHLIPSYLTSLHYDVVIHVTLYFVQSVLAYCVSAVLVQSVVCMHINY